MQTETQNLPMNDKLKDKEEVRVYRLHLLEQNQQKILNKINELEDKIDEDYTKKMQKLDKRIVLLEKCCSEYTKFKWIIIIEAIGILGLILKTSLHL